MHNVHLRGHTSSRRVRTILMIVVIAGSIRIAGRSVVQVSESASAANRELAKSI